MSSYTFALYQIVFSTKGRKRTMNKEGRASLFYHIAGILVNKKCRPIAINGVEDHLHIVTYLHPTVALADLVKTIKVSSSKYIKEERLFLHFDNWQEGYGAFTYSLDAEENLKNYVDNQEIHHSKKFARTSKDEMREFLEDFEVEFDPKYFV